MHNGPNVVAAWSCAEEALRVTSRVEGCRAAADRTWHPPAAPEKRDLSKAGSSMFRRGVEADRPLALDSGFGWADSPCWLVYLYACTGEYCKYCQVGISAARDRESHTVMDFGAVIDLFLVQVSICKM